jgi:hypothetical protein
MVQISKQRMGTLRQKPPNRSGPQIVNNLPENDNAKHGCCHQQGLTEYRQHFSPLIEMKLSAKI